MDVTVGTDISNTEECNMIVVLSNSPKGKRLASYLESQGEKVVLTGEQLQEDWVRVNHPKLVISYGYARIVKSNIISLLDNRIVNAHPSLLPVNRGSYANFWSFIYDTTKGVTIHRIDAGIDTGDILIQKELDFDITKETFQSTYDIIEQTTFDLLAGCYKQLEDGAITPIRQVGEGSYHSLKKFRLFKEAIDFSWDQNIYEFLNRNNDKINNFLLEEKWKDI